MWATEQAPFLMGILVSVIVGVALTLPISSAAICAALGLTGLAGGAAVAGDVYKRQPSNGNSVPGAGCTTAGLDAALDRTGRS